MRKSIVLAILATTAAVGPAQAAIQRYHFEGTLTDIRDYLGTTGVASTIPYGSSFSGEFAFDPNAEFLYQIEPGRALLRAPLRPSRVVVNGIALENGRNELQLFNGNPGMYFLANHFNDFSVFPTAMDGYAMVGRIQLYGDVADFKLPSSLDLTNFPGFFGLTGYSRAAVGPGYFAWHVAGNITQLTAVPEPATWVAMVAGFAMAGGLLRARRRTRGTFPIRKA